MAYFRPQPSVFLLMCLPSGPIAPDPKDSYLLALAEASQAEFLVTGDKQLLSLKQHQSTRIITAAAMVEFLQEAASGGRGTSEAMATVQPSVQSACICFKSSRSRALVQELSTLAQQLTHVHSLCPTASRFATPHSVVGVRR